MLRTTPSRRPGRTTGRTTGRTNALAALALTLAAAPLALGAPASADDGTGWSGDPVAWSSTGAGWSAVPVDQNGPTTGPRRGETQKAPAAGWVRPVAKTTPVSAPYGQESDAFPTGKHTGIDYDGDLGEAVFAIRGGTVTVKRDPAYGPSFVLVDHGVIDGKRIVSRYGHLDSARVRTGDKVTKGQRIGAMGARGNATGPFLHLDVLVAGTFVNPAKYVGKD